jgi:hypothetical protein
LFFRGSSVGRYIGDQGIDETDLLSHGRSAEDRVAHVDIEDIIELMVRSERPKVVLHRQGHVAVERRTMALVVGDVDENIDIAIGNVGAALRGPAPTDCGGHHSTQRRVVGTHHGLDLRRIGQAEIRIIIRQSAPVRGVLIIDECVGSRNAQTGNDLDELLDDGNARHVLGFNRVDLDRNLRGRPRFAGREDGLPRRIRRGRTRKGYGHRVHVRRYLGRVDGRILRRK